jgi:hypothetical protein
LLYEHVAGGSAAIASSISPPVVMGVLNVTPIPSPTAAASRADAALAHARA